MIKFLLFLLTISFLWSAEKPALSMRTYKKLTKIEKLVAENKNTEAKIKLDNFLKNPPQTSIDRAYLFNTAGSFYLNQKEYSKAIQLFNKAFYEYSFSTKQNTQLLELIGNLHIHQTEYDKALDYYELYLKRVYKPEKRIITTIGVAYYKLGKYQKAINLLEKYRELYEPDENIYQMLFSSYLELKKYQQALDISSIMIKFWSKKRDYWLQKTSLYYQLKNSKKALETIELAYNQGVLKNESDYMQYVYLLLENNIPYKAGKLLEKFMKNKLVRNSTKHKELLEQCQIYAR
jgi:tetratricopeptide (TPR) repeat protein